MSVRASASELAAAEDRDRALDHTIVRVQFTPQGKTYHYALTKLDITQHGQPKVGHCIRTQTGTPRIVGFGRSYYYGECRVARVIPQRLPVDNGSVPIGQAPADYQTTAAHRAAHAAYTKVSLKAHLISTAASTGAGDIYQENPHMDTCRYGLIDVTDEDINGAEDPNQALIEKHEAAIAAIKARQKATRKAEKARRRREREQEAIRVERLRLHKVARDTLEAIASNPKVSSASRIAAAAELNKVIGTNR